LLLTILASLVTTVHRYMIVIPGTPTDMIESNLTFGYDKAHAS